jgi:uncharacterized protein with PIN domain/endonuclease/exonuclease/phosphatase family metal-dependent hydrolase
MFSTASWNILGDQYARFDTYPYCSSLALDCEQRHERIISQILSILPNLIAIQELDNPKLEARIQEIGYRTVFAKRPRKKYDGVAIAVDPMVFHLEHHCVLDLNQIVLDLEIASLLKIQHIELSSVKDRYLKDNIALIAVVRHLETNRLIIVVNCHLYWNPLHSEVKLRQIAYILHRMNGFAAELNLEKDIPILLMGDFNSKPSSLVYDFITNGKVEEELDESENTKLLVEGNLIRVAKWLRMMGVDVKFENLDKGRQKEIFSIASAEDRVLITRSKSLVQRSGCPKFVLIPSNFTAEEALQYIVNRFGYPFLQKKLFSRCSRCNSTIIEASLSYIQENTDLPDSLKTGLDEEGDPYKFYSCTQCLKIYWWGKRSFNAINDLRKALNTHEEDEEELFESKSSALKVDLEFIHSLKFKSAYATVKGNEPEFTNITSNFSGTLEV